MATQTYLRLGGRVWHRERIVSVHHTIGGIRGNRVHIAYAQDIHFPWYFLATIVALPFGHQSRSFSEAPIDFSFSVQTRADAEAYVAFLRNVCPNLTDTKPDLLAEGPSFEREE